MPSALPPGPRLGLLQILRYARDPYGFYAACQRRHGDLFTVPTPLGKVVVCGHPDGIRAIFSANPDHLERWSTDSVAPMLGSTSVLLTSGAPHRRTRKLLTPPFHGARMRAYGVVMRDAALREARGFAPGRPFRMQDAASAISIDVILRAVFGVEDPAGLPELREAILGSMHAMTPLIMVVRAARRRFAGLGPWSRFVTIRDRVDALTYRELRARRASGARGDDILSLLLASRYDDGSEMSDQEIRDQLLTLVFAGHETSGIALAWAVYWLERTTLVRERLLAELDALGPLPDPEALASAPYLDAVCAETLRLYPVVPEVIRVLGRPLEVCGHELPAGIAVAACISLVHGRPDLYPEPLEFRPERFVGREYSPFEYLPFGGGSRRCIGAAFALYEMKIVLGTLLSQHRLRLASDAALRPVLRNLTMGPAGGVLVLADSRHKLRPV